MFSSSSALLFRRCSWIGRRCARSRDVLRCCRSFSSPPSDVRTVNYPPSAEDQREMDQCYKRLDLTFTDTKEAFKSKSNLQLLRGLLVLRMCAIEALVKRNQAILKWLQRFTGKRLFAALMKATMYGHFVAGEDQNEVRPTVLKMGDFGVKSILDYSVEADISSEQAEKEIESENEQKPQVISADLHRRYQSQPDFADRRKDVVSARTFFYSGEPECDKNADIFCDCIDFVSQVTDSQGLAAVKLTALGRPKLLLQLSEVIAQTQQFYKVLTNSTWENLVQSRLSEAQLLEKLKEFGMKIDKPQIKDWFSSIDFDQDGFVDLYEWGRLLDEHLKLGHLFKILNLKTGQLEPLIPNLSNEEEVQFHNMLLRLNRIAQYAKEKGVRVMVDAEQTYFQPAISRLTLEMMRRHNLEWAVIFNTYQAYLKNALTNVQVDMHLAKRENFYFSAKLVRGAYMEQERKRAATVGYEDPVNADFDATTAMYTRVLAEILDEVQSRPLGKVSVMCATHNEQSVRDAVGEMQRRGIAPSRRVVCFGQLYGMCDQVSFSLGQAGFSAYKYVPYGPVAEVMPYLSRRAVENSGIVSKAVKERQLIAKELLRRFVTLDWWHRTPPPSQPTNVSAAAV